MSLEIAVGYMILYLKMLLHFILSLQLLSAEKHICRIKFVLLEVKGEKNNVTSFHAKGKIHGLN